MIVAGTDLRHEPLIDLKGLWDSKRLLVHQPARLTINDNIRPRDSNPWFKRCASPNIIIDSADYTYLLSKKQARLDTSYSDLIRIRTCWIYQGCRVL